MNPKKAIMMCTTPAPGISGSVALRCAGNVMLEVEKAIMMCTTPAPGISGSVALGCTDHSGCSIFLQELELLSILVIFSEGDNDKLHNNSTRHPRNCGPEIH